jgi:hypothetical protein
MLSISVKPVGAATIEPPEASLVPAHVKISSLLLAGVMLPVLIGSSPVAPLEVSSAHDEALYQAAKA